MSRYLWVLRVAACAFAGAGALAWLLMQASPREAWARLAFVAALATALYGVVALLAYVLSLLLWPAARPAARAFGARQGLLWAGLVATLVLLRLGGELSLATGLIAVAAFAFVQALHPGWP